MEIKNEYYGDYNSRQLPFAMNRTLGERITYNQNGSFYDGIIVGITMKGCHIEEMDSEKVKFIKWTNVVCVTK